MHAARRPAGGGATTVVASRRPAATTPSGCCCAAGVPIGRDGRRASPCAPADELELDARGGAGRSLLGGLPDRRGRARPRLALLLRDVGVNWTRAGFLARRSSAWAAIVARRARARGRAADRRGAGRRARRRRRRRSAARWWRARRSRWPSTSCRWSRCSGCFAEGETVVRGAAELRVKETDRIAAVVDGLRGLGADIEATPDGFAVRGSPDGLRGGVLDSRGDHRLAMLGAVAGPGLARGRGGRGHGGRRGLLPRLRGGPERCSARVVACRAPWSSRSTAPPGPASPRVARALARARLGFTYLDSGAMYRAVALLRSQRRRGLGRPSGARARSSSGTACCSTARTSPRRSARPRWRRRPRGWPPTRACARRWSRKQRALLASGDWVAEGRDIGTVVAPDAAVKVFLTADARRSARAAAPRELGADVGRSSPTRRCATQRDAAARALAAAPRAGRGRARHHRARRSTRSSSGSRELARA